MWRCLRAGPRGTRLRRGPLQQGSWSGAVASWGEDEDRQEVSLALSRQALTAPVIHPQALRPARTLVWPLPPKKKKKR